jgi:hypothetical protein
MEFVALIVAGAALAGTAAVSVAEVLRDPILHVRTALASS